MSNRVGRDYESVVQLLTDSHNGAETHGTDVGLKHITAALLLAAKDNLAGRPAGPNNNPPALPGLKVLWESARGTKTTKTAALRNACSNGRAQASACIDSLKPAFGKHYNTAWQANGFSGNSLAIAVNPSTMLLELGAFYRQNPTRENPQAEPYPLTAAACQAAADAIETANTASNQSNVDAATAHKNYETALDEGYNLLSNLRLELSQILSDDDERWYAFGFDRPGDPERPMVPENLNVVQGAPGSRMLIAHWDRPRDGDSFRVRAVNKATGDKVVEFIVTESEAVLRDLPANTTLDITVCARNTTGGQSAPCEPFTIAVP